MTSVAQRTEGDDIGGSAAKHSLGVLADRQDSLGVAVDCDDARLPDRDASASHVDERVRGTEIDTDVSGESVM